MEDFANILQRDYGLKPQGKSAPMAGSRGLGLGIGGENGGSSSWREGSTGRASRNGGNGRGSLLEPSLDEFGEDMFGAGSNGNVRAPPRTNLDDPYGLASGSGYDDVFGGPPKYSSPKYGSHDDIFRVSTKPQSGMSKSVNLPVFDTPVYDDDIFGGVPGTRNTSSVFDDVFSASGGGGGGSAAASTSQFEDLLGGYSTATDRKPKPASASASNRSGSVRSSTPLEVDRVFDDLLSGVSSVESSKLRWSTDSKPSQNAEPQPSISSTSPAEVSAGFVDPIISIMQQTSASVPLGSDNLGGQSETFTDGAGSSTEADVIDGFTPTYDSYFPPSSRTMKEGRRKDNAGLASDSTFKDGSGFPLFSSGGDTSPVFPEPETVEPAYFTKSARPAKNIWRKDTGDSATEASFGEGSGFPVFGSSVESASISDTEPIEASYLPKTSRPAKDRQKDTGSSTTNSSIKEESAFAFFGASASPPSIPSEREREEPVPEETWLTVEEIKLVTAPSTMPPPSRRAPKLRYEKEAFSFEKVFENDGAEFSSESSWQAPPVQVRQQAASPPWAPGTAEDVMKEAAARGIDGLEEFVAGVLHKTGAPTLLGEEGQGDREGAGSPPMKDASERGDVKFRLAKEAREKDREEKQREAMIARAIAREREEREAKEQKLREAREKEEKEREAREERERERQRRERLKEREREREKDRAAERAAVERAAAEARERAAVEAKERAERAAFERAAAEARERAANEARERAERAAVERAAAEARERAANEARERAERAAVERAAAEARERAANEARERAERGAVERAAAEARERAANEARERVERAAVERATAEVRERATAEARRAAAESRARAESAAAEAREKAERNAAERARDQQRRSETDWDRLFGNRANSEPRQRPQNSDHAADARSSQTFGSERRGPSSMPPVRKVSSSTNIADDWTSLFAPASQDVFQEIEGETPDRRKARWERHQRTLERAAKALADKNQRDLDQQWEQAEKHRAGEVLDTEIKRWAAGKEGNLRALLSTLQYVLWPECGWQAISLTDIISAIAVKKAYRKATLCVHPDKVQQKGATVQQKYIAEKVFDILKEAWNKFNSEELF